MARRRRVVLRQRTAARRRRAAPSRERMKVSRQRTAARRQRMKMSRQRTVARRRWAALSRQRMKKSRRRSLMRAFADCQPRPHGSYRWRRLCIRPDAACSCENPFSHALAWESFPTSNLAQEGIPADVGARKDSRTSGPFTILTNRVVLLSTEALPQTRRMNYGGCRPRAASSARMDKINGRFI